MRDAAVGFQCPGCVAEGAKSTRSGRTAYGGLRPANPALTSIVLIATNVAVWLAVLATGASTSPLLQRLMLLPTGRCGSIDQPSSFYPSATSEQICQSFGDGRWFPGVADGAYWQLVTSAFTHVEVWHIAFNMLALWFLGPQLEMVLGRARFLAFYLLSALSGSAAVYWLSAEHSATLGASGAVFGLMAALLLLAVKVHGDVRSVLTWVGLNAAFTFLFPGISWQGHLGGFVGGLLLGGVLLWAPRGPRRALVQVAGMTAFGVPLLVAVAARTLALA